MAYTDVTFNGSGTSADPFIIDSCAKWVAFSSGGTSITHIPTGSIESTSTAIDETNQFYWKLGADIDFNNYSGGYPEYNTDNLTATGTVTSSNNMQSRCPEGFAYPRIKELDGNGFKIKNVKTQYTFLKLYIPGQSADCYSWSPVEFKNFVCENFILYGKRPRFITYLFTTIYSNTSASGSTAAVFDGSAANISFTNDSNISLYVMSSYNDNARYGGGQTYSDPTQRNMEAIINGLCVVSSQRLLDVNILDYTNIIFNNSILNLVMSGLRWPLIAGASYSSISSSSGVFATNYDRVANYVETLVLRESTCKISKGVIPTETYPKGLPMCGLSTNSIYYSSPTSFDYIKRIFKNLYSSDIDIDVDYVLNPISTVDLDGTGSSGRYTSIYLAIAKNMGMSQVKLHTDFSIYSNLTINILFDDTATGTSIVNTEDVVAGANNTINYTSTSGLVYSVNNAQNTNQTYLNSIGFIVTNDN